jgi:hypothetical protein
MFLFLFLLFQLPSDMKNIRIIINIICYSLYYMLNNYISNNNNNNNNNKNNTNFIK